MKRIVADWELQSLKEKCLEIVVEKGDTDKELQQLLISEEKEFDYIVVKVPVKSIHINSILAQLGYVFSETQFTVGKQVSQDIINNPYYHYFSKKINEYEIRTKNEISLLFNQIDDTMFITDRISLDPNFGPFISSMRYKNWITNELNNNNSSVYLIYIKENIVGFFLIKRDIISKTISSILGGVFPDNKNKGYGMTIIIGPLSIALGEGFRHLVTKISSNNFEVFRLYNSLNFDIIEMCYVYTKHVNR